MRLKKPKNVPVYTYLSVLRGRQIIVRLYTVPEYCVQIDTETGSQTYALTEEQFNTYLDNVLYIDGKDYHQLKQKALNKVHNSKGYIKKFWKSVVACYNAKMEASRC